ncbi:MAG: tail fiber domain-containing protein [Aeromonas salmonicida]
MSQTGMPPDLRHTPDLTIAQKFNVANTDSNALNTAGGVYAGGNGNFNDVYIRSDRRLKTNMTAIVDALAKVKQLSGNVYDKAGQREAGLIAQELAEVQPESVFLNEDGTLSIAHAGVLALLVEAVKALDEKMEARL